MAEDFALNGIESNPASKAQSVNEALYADAYEGTKCMGGRPGEKCGAPPSIESPTVISSASPSAELPVVRGHANGYPGVYFELPRNLMGETRVVRQASDSSDYLAAKEASKQGKDGSKPPGKDGSKPGGKKNSVGENEPDSENEPKLKEQPEKKDRPIESIFEFTQLQELVKQEKPDVSNRMRF